jgi:cupin fold WbuC family metalloprotein
VDRLEGLPIILRGEDLAALSEEARRRPRLRLNRNLHEMADPVHRLLNAVEPGSYIRPHRHRSTPRDETVVVVSGALGLLLFDDAGTVTWSELLRPAPGPFLADVRAGVWHSFVSLEPGTVFFEAKAGPYVSPLPEDLAGWAPAEGEGDAEELERRWRKMIQTVHAVFTGKGENSGIAT